MGPLPYMWSVVDWKVITRRMTVLWNITPARSCVHSLWYWQYHIISHHHHQILSLLMKYRAPMKASMHWGLQLSPWPHSLTLSHHLSFFATFSSACLSFHIPEDSNLTQFSLLLLYLYVTCVQSNSIFIFLSDFLLTSIISQIMQIVLLTAVRTSDLAR